MRQSSRKFSNLNSYSNSLKDIMVQSLEIAACIANGLILHLNQVKMIILNNNIDIILVSETYYIKKHYFKIPFHEYTIH